MLAQSVGKTFSYKWYLMPCLGIDYAFSLNLQVHLLTISTEVLLSLWRPGCNP
ncbi:hypothetical protein [Spirosoma flavum]|uniref:Uncharacterized protein n=1 Tax=Spirosoma flavum TaxID=2048557 RepID=A0ABW6AMN9_9BACT